jgi:hypothetical protein
MKAATLSEIKKELETLDQEQSQALCLRLAKFKKENKELLTYLLFEARDEQTYIDDIKHEVAELFGELSQLNVYYVKKSLRKILRIVNKHIKYSAVTTTELALRIYFCQQIKEAGLPIEKSTVLINLYDQQLKKIDQALGKLEEDLRYDYQSEIETLIR